MRLWRSATLGVLAILTGCGGGSTPAQPSPPPVDTSSASFTLDGAGYDNVSANFSNAADNLIFCRQEDPGPNTIWIRLAAHRAANGDDSAHIDIDLCNFTGAGNYQAVHAVGGPRTCDQGQTFGLWWHDGGRQFVSRPTSAPCAVNVTPSGNTLVGSFECHGMTPLSDPGTPVLAVTGGTFQCRFP